MSADQPWDPNGCSWNSTELTKGETGGTRTWHTVLNHISEVPTVSSSLPSVLSSAACIVILSVCHDGEQIACVGE